MKYKVQLFIAGRELDFTCYAQSPSGANEVAKAQYPNATIIHTTAIFQRFSITKLGEIKALRNNSNKKIND